ncbi:probable cyclin-dependent serine/threonine-protein kinase DDB_G0292550 [Chrysoperla carnea]|uniref:probable cyclin-dependent serine/threonine-protein kinase DDB_G0292550 n=1 Tax=Chrysoperla carnea TaxID=189513 RepID=UPI001D080683|nr:probable cyclin-dependent serine/threonine-protein kinase DDB_G0292550 [Chrysoperla carnea]
MVILKQIFVFLVTVTIQSALSRDCPILCPYNYEPVCAVNESGIIQVFFNRCELDVAICLNGKPYDDVEWHLCSPEIVVNGGKPNSTGNENKNGTKNDNTVNTTPRGNLNGNPNLNGKSSDGHIPKSDNHNDTPEGKFNSTGNENKNGTKNDNIVNTTPRNNSKDSPNLNGKSDEDEHVPKPCGYNKEC